MLRQLLMLIVAFALPCGAADFENEIRPLLKQYCLGCHSQEKHKGDLDLERFDSLAEVKKHPKIWQRVAEQLADNEMPPKEKPQPSSAQREQLLAWVNGVLNQIAFASAGNYRDVNRTFTWSRPGRLGSSSDGSTYYYDGRGRRVQKTDANGTTLYHYDSAGLLISETTATGSKLRTIIGNAMENKDGWVPRWMAFPQRGYSKRRLTKQAKLAA